MIAGVAIQVVVTFFFTLLLIDYFVRRSLSEEAKAFLKPVKCLFIAVMVTTIAVFIRCTFRVVEIVSHVLKFQANRVLNLRIEIVLQSQGWKGYLATHEYFLIFFDGLPLTIATLVSI